MKFWAGFILAVLGSVFAMVAVIFGDGRMGLEFNIGAAVIGIGLGTYLCITGVPE